MDLQEKRAPMIKFEKVNFQYDSQAEKNLIDINFDVYAGETILIVGPSGSGKSTIARCINGQIPNTYPGQLDGVVSVNGKEVQTSSIFDLSLEVGTVLQDTDGQFVGLTVAEDIAFALENDGVEQEKMQSIVKNWSETLEIDDLLQSMPNKLSGGQKQRVSISGILVNNAPILLFDEPLANLDPASGAETMRLINRLSKEHNYTTIIVEHRLEEALLGDINRILVIDEGRLVSDSTPTELLKSSILQEVGVREPLYLTAMKYAGIDVSKYDTVNNFNQMNLFTGDIRLIEEWASQVSHDEYSNENDTILAVDHFNFSYNSEDDVLTLSDINFSVNQGEMISIVGTNGAGKSTLAKAISGFIKPSSGKIIVNAEDINDLSIKEIADTVGFIMQNPNNMISKTMIYEEVALGLINRGWNENDIEEKVFDTLKICGLFPYRNWPISALSYGQKRRVTIASILVLDPNILILDEPTAGQDFAHYTEMMQFLNQLNHERDMTILMITHDMHLMQEYTNRSLVFDAGKLLADTNPSELFSNAQLLKAAHLTESSLYQLGSLLPLMTSKDFIGRFMRYERGIR